MTRPQQSRRGAGRRVLTGLLVALVGSVVLMAAPQAAQATDYQYWGYWQLSTGAWAFSQTGPTQSNPPDGSVEGWRWAVADETGRPPRIQTTFDAVCGATPAAAGTKRVAVVIDFGRPADGDGMTQPPEPIAECAQVDSAATGADVLAAVSTVRNGDAGLVCGIDGYPGTGCGGDVPTLSDAQKAPDTSATLGPTATPQGPAVGTVPAPGATAGPVATAQPGTVASSGVSPAVWVGLVILLAGAALLVWTAYRRRQQDA